MTPPQDGPVTEVEWRVAWTMWPHASRTSIPMKRVTVTEADAREQYEGLVSMLAPHELRPCDDHIWDPRLERCVVTRECEVVEQTREYDEELGPHR